MLNQPALMELLPLRQHGLHQRDAHRAAEVARDIDQRGGLVGLVGRDAVIGRRRDGEEEQRQPDREIDARHRGIAVGDVAINTGQMPHRQSRNRGSRRDQVSRLHRSDQLARDRHHHHGDEAARRQHQPRQRRGVIQLGLQQLRQDLRGRDHDRAGAEHGDEAGAELALAEQADVDDRVFGD